MVYQNQTVAILQVTCRFDLIYFNSVAFQQITDFNRLQITDYRLQITNVLPIFAFSSVYIFLIPLGYGA